ncbi:hypothetical protein ACQP2K_29620 [Microbispora siamensis]
MPCTQVSASAAASVTAAAAGGEAVIGVAARAMPKKDRSFPRVK